MACCVLAAALIARINEWLRRGGWVGQRRNTLHHNDDRLVRAVGRVQSNGSSHGKEGAS